MKDKDFKIIVTKGSGPGGQHKNKVETCVIITHIPTGIVEKCQDTRSKLKNIELAKKRIQHRLELLERDKINKAKNERRLELIKNSKTIRTYNFVRNEVIDHRSNKKYNLKRFLDGEIENEIAR